MARTPNVRKNKLDCHRGEVQLDLFLSAMYEQYGAGQAPAPAPAKPKAPLNPYARHLQRMRAMRDQQA